MKKALGTIAVALLALAGCGGDTCSSQDARVTPQNQGCTLAANAPVTINVRLCPQCTDSSPSCQAELRPGNIIEVSPVVQQCQANQGCDITQQCQISPVACPVNASLQAGTYTASYLNASGSIASSQVDVAPGGSASCTL
ncbi:MAG TPA: hypothetical protein VFP65_10590 [Anaeromyxobacteraceae bacterium]|nr:hypothetical protein [Anaeromyxobacteraceae bacterium]